MELYLRRCVGITSTPSRNLSLSWRRSGRRAALRRPSGSQHWPTGPRRARPKGPCPRRRRRKPRRASTAGRRPARPARDVERTPRLTSQLKDESTVTPDHAFNLEVHEVDLRAARTRFLLDSLETTLCACGRCVRADDHDRRVAGRIKSTGDAAAHFVFLQPDHGVAAFPAFSVRA